MLVHCKVTPIIKVVGSQNTPGWREALWEWSVVPMNTTQFPQPGPEPAQSGDRHINHEATTSQKNSSRMHWTNFAGFSYHDYYCSVCFSLLDARSECSLEPSVILSHHVDNQWCFSWIWTCYLCHQVCRLFLFCIIHWNRRKFNDRGLLNNNESCVRRCTYQQYKSCVLTYTKVRLPKYPGIVFWNCSECFSV